MVNVLSEYAGDVRSGMFSASKNCLQILAIWVCVDIGIVTGMRWWQQEEWHNDGTQFKTIMHVRKMWSSWVPVVMCLQWWGWLNTLPNCLKQHWRRIYSREISIQFNSSGGCPWSQYVQIPSHLWHCAKQTYVIVMSFNQHLDAVYLSG